MRSMRQRRAPSALDRRRQRLLLLLVVPVLGSCSTEPANSGVALPPPAPQIDVALREYRFDLAPELPVGRVVFRFTNEGGEPHEPALLRLDDDFPVVQDEVRNDESRQLLPYTGIPTQPPGSTGTFAVDLVPGQRYALVCFLSNPQGEGHARLGMTWEARAGGGSTAPTPTSAPEVAPTTSTPTTGG